MQMEKKSQAGEYTARRPLSESFYRFQISFMVPEIETIEWKKMRKM